MTTDARAVQTLTIEGWLPAAIANGPHGHWATRHRKLQVAQDTAQWFARAAGWQRVSGRARLDVVLVFPGARRRDTDNLYARVKGVVDGLKPFFVDDSTDWLNLHVSARVERRRKAVELTLTDLGTPTARGEAGQAA